MAYIEFGNSWWGAKWLDALIDTDYSNRLPRGKRYARNGSVKKVGISGVTVSADVKGSRPRPYKVRVSLPKFTTKDKKAIVEAVIDNPLILSQLLARRLPPALYEVFEEKNIPLFPDSWDDISANCSCPDWAACCKHIAAVIYLIANEVDKNPFLLFELHDFDIFSALVKKGFSIEKHSGVAIASPKQLILKRIPPKTKPLTRKKRDELLGGLDFSTIPPVRDELLLLLGDKPLFYPYKDFKPLLEKALKHFARMAIKEMRELKAGLEEKSTDTIFTDARISISNVLDLTGLELAAQDETWFADNFDDFFDLLAMLFAIPRKQIRSHHHRAVTLSLLVHFALKLLEQGAVLPEILSVSKGHHIRWVPALISPQVAQIFDTICELSPDDLVTKPKLAKTEQVKTMLSGILSNYIQQFVLSLSSVPSDEITRIFFDGHILNKSKKFEQQEVAENIALWLSSFHIASKTYVPLVKVDETDGGFSMELMVEDRKQDMKTPIPLKKILKLKKYAAVKYDILKDVTLLADYLPEISDFLASGGETCLKFTPAAFEDVLFRHLPTLKLLNIPILLPKGLNHLVRPHMSARVTKSTSESTKTYLSLDDMFSFQWQIAIGDQIMSRNEFEKLVRGLSGIVKIKDQFVYIDQTEIAKILKNLENEPRLTSKEAFKAVLAGEYKGEALKLDDEVKVMIHEMMNADPLPVPDGLQATLRDYQHRGFEWLSRNARLGFGSLIADDMGLGKTIQIITLLLQMLDEGRLDKAPALVVVPTTLLTNWRREADKFAPDLHVHIYHGAARQFKTKGVHVFLTTYGLLRRDSAKFAKPKWAAIIIDEAQAIKNHGTAQTKAVKKIKSDLRIAMTGTPVENRLTEYWSIFDFLNKGYLKGVKTFKSEFAMPIEVDRNQQQLALFRKITAPFILRRMKTDKSIIKDLPDKIEIDQYCQLEKEQAALYQTTMDQIMEQIEQEDDIARHGLVLKLITALKQICNHPSHFLKRKTMNAEKSGKTALLMELMGNMAANEEKLLIFTQYTQMGNLLQRLIGEQFGLEPLFLHGGLTRKKRDQMVDDFQTQPYVKTMILSLKAGGTGLNLTAAQNVVHFDLWWNPAVEAQATDRAYRIGQTSNVMVHRLITRGSFEEKINAMLKDKRELADMAVSQGEKWIGEYSNKDLREIFALE
ncbi:MAG: SNF2-related protein [Hyphomicrobiaceae bacterium]|nr:SNF2-related protein [Hyphomicrobiaceae bacterium]